MFRFLLTVNVFQLVHLLIGRYQTGPAPLRAIKEGNVKLKYDVRFIFAEVNADTVYWSRLSPDQEFKPIRVDRRLIGMYDNLFRKNIFKFKQILAAVFFLSKNCP